MTSALPITTDTFFNGSWDYESTIAANASRQDVKFNQPDQFQNTRQLRLTAKFTF